MEISATQGRSGELVGLIECRLVPAYRLARAILLDEQEAEDAVQDACLAVWRARGSLRDLDRFEAWFDRILVNGCRDRLRARQRRQVRALALEHEARVSVADPGGDHELVEALAALDADHRIVVLLRFVQDLPLEEIGRRLDLPLGTVKSRLHYALEPFATAWRPDMDDREFEGRLRARMHREFGAARPSDAFLQHTLEAMRAQIDPSPCASLRRLVAAAAAIVIAVSVVIVRSGTTGPAVAPPVSAPEISSASLSPSAATSPTPTPSPLPSLVDEGMSVVVVDPGVMRVALIPERPTEQAGAAPTGPYAYLRGIADSRYQSLFVADAGGGSERQVPLALLAGEQIDEVPTDAGWIVVAVSRPATPSPTESQLTCAQLERQPRAWRILAAPLDSGGMPAVPFARVDAGVASRAFELPQAAGLSCPYPAVPPVAVAADTVAYAVESAPGGASAVIVRSLPTGALLRSYASPSQVYQLALSSTTVAWSETANGLTDGQTPDWRVMTASTTRGAPRQVPLGVVAGRGHEFPPGLLLDGTAVVASLDQFTGSKGTVVRVDGDQIETIDPGHANRNCWAAGAARGVVVLDCNGTTVSGDTATAMISWVAVWSGASGLRALGGLTIAPGELSINTGWAVWTGVDADQRSVLVGVLLSAVR